MRKENRRMKPNDNKKTIMYGVGSIIAVIILAFIAIFIVSGGTKQSNESNFSTAKINNLVPNESQGKSSKIEQASTQIGKSINEVQSNTTNTIENVTNSVSTKTSVNTSKTKTSTSNTKEKQSSEKISKTSEDKQSEVEASKTEEKPLIFIKPVDGEIIREFAKDKLVYSETLKEWVTHPGIDIKSEKTSIVKAAADGRVSSIKNDPRYGLTVVIEHQSGYKTVYSNLLTAEFVTEGEEVTSGQTIGTVGNTANFEILDEDHLHFEILKDNENIDPGIYIQ